MQKILLINGSPKGKKSNTRKIALEFLKGFNADGAYTVEEIVCCESRIEQCKGCFGCWKNEKGQCVIQDDMQEHLPKYLDADLVVWSFPNHYYGMASRAKIFLDRLLPVLSPNLVDAEDGTTSHPYKYAYLDEKKYLLFCTSGFYNLKKNVEAIDKQFELLYGNQCERIFCAEGQLLSNDYLQYKTNQYFEQLRKAGQTYRQKGFLTAECKEELQRPLLQKDAFLRIANAHWLIVDDAMSAQELRREKARVWMQSMAATYNPDELRAEQSILELEIADCAYTCQLILNKENCSLIEDPQQFAPYRLKLITNLEFFTNLDFFRFNAVSKQKTKRCMDKPHFSVLVQMINKYEQRGQSKEIKIG